MLRSVKELDQRIPQEEVTGGRAGEEDRDKQELVRSFHPGKELHFTLKAKKHI